MQHSFTYLERMRWIDNEIGKFFGERQTSIIAYFSKSVSREIACRGYVFERLDFRPFTIALSTRL